MEIPLFWSALIVLKWTQHNIDSFLVWCGTKDYGIPFQSNSIQSHMKCNNPVHDDKAK